MSFTSQRKRVPKVHLLGPWTGGGFRRTLCEHALERLRTTQDAAEVTCAICTWRMAEKAK